MHILVRAVITGFGLALGAAIYKRVAKRLGIEDAGTSPATTVTGSGDPVPSSR